MKKKIILSLCILLAVILLFPIPYHLKDGGTVVYQAILYSVEDVHRLAPLDDLPEHPYFEGIRIKILGIKVFDNVK